MKTSSAAATAEAAGIGSSADPPPSCGADGAADSAASSSTSDVTGMALNRSNIVAASDLDAAKAAIRRRIDGARVPRDVDCDPEHVHALLDRCAQSLVDKLDLIAYPVADEAYHRYLYETLKDDDDDDSDDEKVQPEEGGGGDADEEDDNFEFDELELIDENALQRARQLRKEVREQASKVKQLRESVLNKAVELSQRQVDVWKKESCGDGTCTDENSENDSVGGKRKKKNAVEEMLNRKREAVEGKVREMEKSLAELNRALKATQTQLPEKLAQLEETVSTIETTLSKRGDDGGVQALSQTERAIVSRDNEGFGDDPMDDPESCCSSNSKQQKLPPEDQLANHLRF